MRPCPQCSSYVTIETDTGRQCASCGAPAPRPGAASNLPQPTPKAAQPPQPTQPEQPLFPRTVPRPAAPSASTPQPAPIANQVPPPFADFSQPQFSGPPRSAKPSKAPWVIGLIALGVPILGVAASFLLIVFTRGVAQRAEPVRAVPLTPRPALPAPAPVVAAPPLVPPIPTLAPTDEAEPEDGSGRTVQANVRDGSSTVRGSLSKEVIRRVVRRYQAQVRRCYERGLRQNPDAQGRVVVSFIVDPRGGVTSASIRQSTLGEPQVERCITEAVKRWRFPAPDGGGIVIVNYPFMLSTN